MAERVVLLAVRAGKISDQIQGEKENEKTRKGEGGLKIGILRNKVRENATAAEKLFDLGENSGNLVFWDAIEKLFSPIRIGYNETDRLKDFDRVILTDLIWIRENTDFDYLERIVDANAIPFIPISIGLQSTTYDIHFRLSNRNASKRR